MSLSRWTGPIPEYTLSRTSAKKRNLSNHGATDSPMDEVSNRFSGKRVGLTTRAPVASMNSGLLKSLL